MHLTSLALALALLPVCRLTAFTPTSTEGRELARIRIVNDVDGSIGASYDGGQSWTAVGRVLRYTTRTNPRGYTASKWVPAGRVAATAVNALHISVGYNREDDRGVIVSLLPREFLTPVAGYNSYLSPDSSIYTNIAAGESIFGGGIAPFVGNPVYLEAEHSRLLALPADYLPTRGDVLVIVLLRPDPYPIAAEFENWEGGAISLRYPDGSSRLLGWVIRPVRGIGRFAGSLYASVGRVRAGHAGVVDISTSPTGFLGAFQVIPFGHALSPEMNFAWSKSQWMIAGPARVDSPLWEGLMPLFYQHVRPDYLADDLYGADWQARLLSRFLVEVDRGDGWEPIPCLRLAPDPAVPLPAWADNALEEARRVRILFPLTGDFGRAGQ